MARNDDLIPQKVAAFGSWLLPVIAGTVYLTKHKEAYVAENPFTISQIFVLLFELVLLVLQVLFVVQLFVAESALGSNRLEVSQYAAWNFALFNVLQFVWILLFSHHHFFWSEVVLIINLGNIVHSYFERKTYQVKTLVGWITVHVATVALPLVWLSFNIFWNGAALFHVHKQLGRIVANLFVWVLFFINEFFIITFNDWGTGLGSSFLALGLGFGQLATKLFALQWIFAFVISGLLFVSTVYVFVIQRKEESSEGAPLLE